MRSMERGWRACAVLLLAAAPFAAQAQTQASAEELRARLAGRWVAVVEGEARARMLDIRSVAPHQSLRSHAPTATFGWVDDKLFALKFGQVDPEGDRITMRFTTLTDAQYTLQSQPDGGFTGSMKPASGPEKKVRMARAAAPELLARLAGPWVATVQGEARKRALAVYALSAGSDGAYALYGDFTYADLPTPSAFSSGEVKESAGQLLLRFQTGAKSDYELAMAADGGFSGTATYANGQKKAVTLVKEAVDGPITPFSRDEMKELVTGKKVSLRRYRDDRVMHVDFAPDGSFKAMWMVPEKNPFNQRNRYYYRASDEGTWSIDERGSLCMKWLRPGDKTCADLYARRSAGKILFHRALKPGAAAYGVVLAVR